MKNNLIRFLKEQIERFIFLAKVEEIRVLFVRMSLFLIFAYLNIKRKKTIQKMNDNKSKSFSVKIFDDSILYINPLDAGLSLDLYAYNKREPTAVDYLFSQLNSEDVFYDIGANIGYYTLIVSKKVKLVVALEPIKESFKTLQKNIEFNKVDNVVVYNMALGDISGESRMYIPPQRNWATLLRNDKDSSQNYINEKVRVDVLDDFLQKNSDLPPPTWIKMDIEGGEYFVIKGAIKTLQEYHPDIFIELHTTILGEERKNEIFKELLNLKYRIEFYFVTLPFHWYCASNMLKKVIKYFSNFVSRSVLKKEKIEMEDLIENKIISSSRGFGLVLFLKYKP